MKDRTIHLLPKTPQHKANLHCHSTLSDGCYTPTEIKKLYQAQGYDVVAFTDHDYIFPHTDLTDEAFVALTGYEMQIMDDKGSLPRCKRDVVHLNFIAKDPDNRTLVYGDPGEHYDGDPAFSPDNIFTDSYGKKRILSPAGINAIIEEAADCGFLVSFNHPTWSFSDRRHYCGLKGLTCMEIYNTCCEYDGHDTYCPTVYDEFLRDGQQLFCIATDDNHNRSLGGLPKDADSFDGFTMLCLTDLNYQNVISALVQGDLYASRGPLIHEISVTGNHVHLETSPAKKIMLSCGCRRDDSVRLGIDVLLSSADFSLQGIEDYIRFTVTDAAGRSANSRAYFPEDFLKLM